MKKKGKIIKSIFILTLFLEAALVLKFKYDFNDIYCIYKDKAVIGYVEGKKEGKNLCKEFFNTLNNRIPNINLSQEEVKLKKVNNNSIVNSKEEIEAQLLNTINKINPLVQIVIGDKTYGIIANKEEGKAVLKRIGEIYVDKLNLDVNKIISMDIKSNFDYKELLTEISNLNTIDEVAQNIIKDNDTKNIVDVNIQYREEKVVEILPEVVTEKKDDLYIGESLTEEGEKGSSEVVSNVLICNGEIVEEDILEETTLKEPVNTVVYKGIKSPVCSDVRFLTHPTKGGYITSEFGRRWGRNHNGIDIAHNTGDPVYASMDGVVKEASYKYSYGNKILINHGEGLETIYAHLDSFNVKVGDVVKKGDLIGRVGNTGNSTGSHLHFELRVNGEPINPKKYIEGLG